MTNAFTIPKESIFMRDKTNFGRNMASAPGIKSRRTMTDIVLPNSNKSLPPDPMFKPGRVRHKKAL